MTPFLRRQLTLYALALLILAAGGLLRAVAWLWRQWPMIAFVLTVDAAVFTLAVACLLWRARRSP